MKIAIITGASSGMGRRMAIELNDTIPNIEAFWLFGRRVERLEALEKQLTKPCRFFTDDLQTSAVRDTLQRALAEEAPEIVFLVNAAGFGQIGTIRGLSLEDQLGMVDLNIGALTAITRLCLPYMAPKSRILNFASSAAFLPQPNFAVYAASKSYVLSFSQSLAEELRTTGIRVTAVCPGPVKTEFFERAETSGHIPFYKYLFMANPEKVCHLALMDSVLGKGMSVYGVSMKLLRILSKLLPTKLIMLSMRLLNGSCAHDGDVANAGDQLVTGSAFHQSKPEENDRADVKA